MLKREEVKMSSALDQQQNHKPVHSSSRQTGSKMFESNVWRATRSILADSSNWFCRYPKPKIYELAEFAFK